MLFALRQIDSAYWRFDLWGWLVAGFASDGTMAVGNTVISSVTAPEDQGVATCECPAGPAGSSRDSIERLER
jgi:hypothetical protein